MEFSFNDDQIAIRELAYQIFTDRATDEFLLEFSRGDATYDDALWTTLAEQGLLVEQWRGDQGLLAATNSGAGLPVGQLEISGLASYTTLCTVA